MVFWSLHKNQIHEALRALHKLKEEQRITAKLIADADAIASNLNNKLNSGIFQHDENLEKAIAKIADKAEKDSSMAVHLLGQLVGRLEEEAAEERNKRLRAA